MKNTKISRRSFLLGLAACSAAGVLTACKGTDAPSGSTASSAAEQPASSAASSAVQQAEPFLTVEDFPPLDGSTACIPLMAQMLADTTGMDLEEARSSITVSTTAYAWENFGLYDTTTRMLVVYEAPDYVKEELQEAGCSLGTGDRAMQKANLDRYEARLVQRIAELQKGLPERKRLCQSLGIMGGLFLFLILV